MRECEWFLHCDRESVATVEHPTVGDVEICQRCLDWLLEDATNGVPNPTKMVPPMAARHGRKLQAIFDRLEDDEEDEEVTAA
jgi:hypothetical protein